VRRTEVGGDRGAVGEEAVAPPGEAARLVEQAVEAGAQGALLAPTEILARQHYDTLRRQLGGLPMTSCSPTSSR